ncbi:rod shape-determining protein [Planctomycetota bacterium]
MDLNIFDFIAGFLSIDMGIDLGTANTLVYVKDKGIIIDEPSVVAVHRDTNIPLDNGRAVGRVAKEMVGKTPADIIAVRPLKEGVIADFDIAEVMLDYFIKKVHKWSKWRSWLAKPQVVISVPSGITSVERRAVRNSAERVGARNPYLIEEPIAAAIGANLPIGDPRASMIIDIGGGTTEVAVISLGGIVTSESLRVGGDEMDRSIINYMKKEHSLQIGDTTAENIKIDIGSAYPLEEETVMEVRGRDMVSGMPRTCKVSSEEIRDALKDPVNEIVGATKATLEKTAPELAGDLIDSGITLCGGGALLRGIDKVIAAETGLKVTIAEDPMRAVVKGTGFILEHLAAFKKARGEEE